MKSCLMDGTASGSLAGETGTESEAEGLRARAGNVGLYRIGKCLPRSEARRYPDEMEISVAYLEKERRILISTHPKSSYDFGPRYAGKEEIRTEVAGITFQGSSHSAGSVVEKPCTWEDAKKVYGEIIVNAEKYIFNFNPSKRSCGEED